MHFYHSTDDMSLTFDRLNNMTIDRLLAPEFFLCVYRHRVPEQRDRRTGKLAEAVM